MECEKPAKRGKLKGQPRTGTAPGWRAHRAAKEEPCEACVIAYQEENRRYYEKNAEKMREKSRTWHHANKEYANKRSKQWREENWEQSRANVDRWHREHKEELKAYQAEYREANREKARDYAFGYYVENKGKFRGYSRKRRAIRASLPVEDYSPEDVTAAHGVTCDLCGTEVDVTLEAGRSNSPHVDHVHPISRDGCPGDVLSNVRWTHAICNITKKDKLNDELELPLKPPTGDEWNRDIIATEEGFALVI